MQPAAWCQEPRGFGKRGVWRWKAPSAIIQAVPTQAQNTKRCQMLHTLLWIAITISVSLFANTELRERESHNTKVHFHLLACPLAGPSGSCSSQSGLLLSAAKAEMSKIHVPMLGYKRMREAANIFEILLLSTHQSRQTLTFLITKYYLYLPRLHSLHELCELNRLQSSVKRSKP